jgi:hypothetical protein
VGGVVVLGIIGLAIWFFTWRPRRQQGDHDARSSNWNKPELPDSEMRRGSKLRPGELESRTLPAQLETKTDRAELDAYQYAIAMQGVQSPVEMEAGHHHSELDSHMDQRQAPDK